MTINRDKGSFGFVLRSHAPVYIEKTTPLGAADKAGIIPGDAIIKVNGLDVRSKYSQNKKNLLIVSCGLVARVLGCMDLYLKNR